MGKEQNFCIECNRELQHEILLCDECAKLGGPMSHDEKNMGKEFRHTSSKEFRKRISPLADT